MDEKVYIYKLFSNQELFENDNPLRELFALLINEDSSKVLVEYLYPGIRFSIYRSPVFGSKSTASSGIKDEKTAQNKSLEFIAAFNEGISVLHALPQPKVSIPWLVPDSLVLLNPYSTGSGSNTSWYFEYGILLKTTEKRQSTVVQNARVTVALDDTGEIALFELQWKPIRSRSSFDPANPELHFQAYVEEQKTPLVETIGQKQPLGPAIIYYLRSDEDILLPYYAGSNLPVISEDLYVQAQIKSPCPDDEGVICSIYDLPLWQLELLIGLGVNLEQFDNNHWFLTNLFRILNEYQHLQQQHLDGDFPINSSNDFAEIHYQETGQLKQAGYRIEKDFGKFEISTSIHLTYPDCRVVLHIKYEDFATGLILEPEEPAVMDYPCMDPNLPEEQVEAENPYAFPNFENTFEPDATYVVTPRESGLEILLLTAPPLETEALPEESIQIDGATLQQAMDDLKIMQIQQPDALNMQVIGSEVYVPGFDKGLYFKKANTLLTPNKLTGEIGELQFSKNLKDFAMYRNLEYQSWQDKRGNLRRGNFPIFDSQGSMFSKNLYSVKASGASTYRQRLNYYKNNGFYDITGGQNSKRTDLFNRISDQLMEKKGLSGDAAQRKVLQNAVLAINKDDVYLFREDVKKWVIENPDKYNRILNALMDETPIKINGQEFRSLGALDDAYKNKQISLEQKIIALEKLALRVSKKIVSNGVSTKQVQNTKNLVGDLSPDQVRQTIRPEDQMIARLGNSKGTAVAGIRSGATSAFLTTGMNLISGEEVSFVEVVANSGGATIGTMAEVQVSTALRNVGVRSALTRGWLSGGIGGGISAPLTEIGIMLMDPDVDYSAEDYWGRGVRTSVGGFVSGATATYVVSAIGVTTMEFTIAGTIVPGLGNVVGFIVGFIVGVVSYMIYDYLLGDTVESATRNLYKNLMDEEFYLVGNWDVEDFLLFPIVKQRVEQEDNIVVRTTGYYISKVNPINDHEVVFFEVIPESDEAEALFGERAEEFVPRSMLKKKR